MISALKDALKASEIWPEEDQEALVPLRERLRLSVLAFTRPL
jgi:hypothetical protein